MTLAQRCAQRDAERRIQQTIDRNRRADEASVRKARRTARKTQARARFITSREQSKADFRKLGTQFAELGTKIAQEIKEDAAYSSSSFTSAARYDDNGTPHCPRCGNTTFRARRSAGRWTMGIMTLGVAAPLVSRNAVECTACRTRFRR